MIRFDTFSAFGKMIGCLFSSFRNDLLSRPPTHIIPIPIKNASNYLIVELLGIVTSLFLLGNALSSAENLFSWTNLINWTSLSWSRSLPCNGSLVAAIFIFLRRICLNLNTQDMTLFILSRIDISLSIGEVCQKILLCSLFWVSSLILDRQMIHRKTFC